MGKASRLPERLSKEDEDCFPNLHAVGYRVTSPKDVKYNCFAYAAGEMHRKWDPSMIPIPGYFWPKGVERNYDPETVLHAFESVGFVQCESSDLEEGFEKIAIYYKDKEATHAARQDATGAWLSKLGNEEDIKHKHPHCFGGSIYGEVIFFMKRPVTESK